MSRLLKYISKIFCSLKKKGKRNCRLKGKRSPKVHPSCLKSGEPLKQLREMNLESVCE